VGKSEVPTSAGALYRRFEKVAMSTIPPGQQDAGKDDLVQYVEELAGPEEYPEGDAWISLTDAARITRTSEAMARRWVTSGRLKVKKEPVGVPARTRLVRMSDVAAIRPIVDPTAAITGDVRKLDLPSIPRQQVQIMEDHQRLLKQVQEALDASKQHAAETHTALERLTTQLQQQGEDLRHQLSTQHDELQRALEQERQRSAALAEQVCDQARQIEQHNTQLLEQGRQHQQEMEQLRTHLLGQLEEVQQAFERKLSEQDQEYRSQVEQLRRDLTQQQEAFTTLRRDMTTLIEQQIREVFIALEQVARDQAQDVAAQNERLGTIEKRLEEAVQDSRLQEVKKLLQDEIAARQALEQQVQQQAEQLAQRQAAMTELSPGQASPKTGSERKPR